MLSEITERRVTKPQQMGNPLPPPPAEQEPLPCPRCDSTNTKFCYYNNYNFSQPRHFCKSCRRYWTHGGTLRDIPVGGGSRKNAKRSRTAIPSPATAFTSSSVATTTTTTASSCCPLDPIPAAPLFVSLSGSAGGGPYAGDVSILKPGSNVSLGCVPSNGSFTSLLNTSGPAAGFLALGGLGLGIEDVGFGFGRGAWPFPEVGYLSSGGGISGTGGGDGGVVASSGGGGNASGNTWQVETGAENAFVGGDYFSWPELAISTAGNRVK